MSQVHVLRGHGRRQQNNNKNKQFTEEEETNPLLKAFRTYSRELDAKHDRYERIVKMSRDITIESKRIIFLLHSIGVRKSSFEDIIAEAKERLNNLMANNFKSIAIELDGFDIYQYRGAYSPGLQEFIEAYTFMEYLQYSHEQMQPKPMSDWQNLQEQMKYFLPIGEEKTGEVESEAVVEKKEISFVIIPTEFILGLADLTGELMRRCINSLGSGETEVCLSTCRVLQQLYNGYISLHVPRWREISRKIVTMRQSVLKSEQVCYNIKVRGGEAAKWGAMYDNKDNDADEGFF